jgi:hypothetical protein
MEFPLWRLAPTLDSGNQFRTEANIALFKRSKILVPWAIASADPMNKLPTEQMDSSKSEFFADGRNVGPCSRGNIGLKRVKYIRMQRF